MLASFPTTSLRFAKHPFFKQYINTTLPTGKLKVAWYGLFKKQRCVLRIVVPHGYLAVRLPLLLPLACVTWRFFRLRKSQTKLVVNGSKSYLPATVGGNSPFTNPDDKRRRTHGTCTYELQTPFRHLNTQQRQTHKSGIYKLLLTA